MYLDYAEDQAKLRNAITMQQWLDKLDAFLTFNDRALLTHTGKMRMDVAKKLASEKYEMFDSRRKIEAANKADEEDFQTLEELAKKSKGKK